MGKILVIIVLVAIAVAWLRARARQDTPSASAQPPAEAMVTCAHCSLNLPAGEAVFDAAGTPFCGAPHLEARRAERRP